MWGVARVEGWCARWLRFGRDCRGLAAIEFAMVAPLMVILFLGSVEFSQALTLDRRVTAAASATADLVAQSEQVTPSDIDDIMLLAEEWLSSALIGNYNPSQLEVKLVSLSIDPDSKVTVLWSRDKAGGEPYAPGSTYNGLPTELIQPNSGVVVAEVSYSFDPPVGHFIVGSINLSEKFYLRPRRSSTVPCNGC